ncbi:uncharacterized protein BDZ99DRAFT_503296 [Mytilinidion resinicola]|uniref:Uncharacterized protein n=1 Tax=Mytilinidion resinicola TaxID=574789 RepID=A0A6A6Y624_9PEZI|nr:uncharacterized protein BDZ99DRAFT_503296 [Mytilinidion resinicola]KAF2803247.1 hypothetical protein BDZ99DRAFT_503296 [Mytilinidion resinicola]
MATMSPHCLPSISLLLIIAFLAPLVLTECFYKYPNGVVSLNDEWHECPNTAKTPGGPQLCCAVSDECGEDSICYNKDPSLKSGFYPGGCTDSSYADSVCEKACSEFKATEIIYNYTENLWHCCGDQYCTSDPPTDVTFQAVSPKQWSALPLTQTATVVTYASSSTTLQTSSSPSSSTTLQTSSSPSSATLQSSSPSPTPSATMSATWSATTSATPSATTAPATGGLSKPAKAGIGVGGSIAGLSVLALLLLLRRERAKRMTQRDTQWIQGVQGQPQVLKEVIAPTAPAPALPIRGWQYSQTPGMPAYSEASYHGRSELPAYGVISELGTSQDGEHRGTAFEA